MGSHIDGYDHHKKAGNEGDICKHPALIAALCEAIKCTPHIPFTYADVYAGYSKSPLIDGNEWPKGIGIVAGEDLLKGNPHIDLWARIAGLERAPAPGNAYPGSAWFASEIGRRLGRRVVMSLWDTASEPFLDLRATFLPPDHRVFGTAATGTELMIKCADFVFIDPPDKSQENCKRIFDIASQLGSAQSLLIWLPIAPNTTRKPPLEDEGSFACREKALALGLGVTNSLG